MKRTIRFRCIQNVIEFVGKSTQCIGEVKIDAGNSIIIDGKSLMGLFSIDLSKDLLLVYNEGMDKEFDKYISKIYK